MLMGSRVTRFGATGKPGEVPGRSFRRRPVLLHLVRRHANMRADAQTVARNARVPESPPLSLPESPHLRLAPYDEILRSCQAPGSPCSLE